MSTHLPVEWLSGYVDGKVTADEGARIEAHLAACAACRGTLDDLRRTVALVRGLDPVPAPADFRAAVRAHLQAQRTAPVRRRLSPLSWSLPARPSWRTALAAAAVVLVGLFSVNLWQQVSLRSNRETNFGRRLGPAVQGVDVPTSMEGSGNLRGDRLAAQPVGAPAAQAPASPAMRLPFERQVIRAAEMAVEVRSFEDTSKALVRIAESAGGFVADSNTVRVDPPYGTFVLRVPALRFPQILDQVEGLGKVTDRHVSGQDVTEEFVDLQSRVRNLQAHERQLITFMGRATRVADLLAIEQELSRVRGEIETLSGRLRFLANRVELATIQVTLREKAKQSAPAFWDFTASLLRVRDAFLGTIRQLLAAAELGLVALSAVLPLGLVALAGWGVIRWYIRRNASVI